MDDDSEDYEYEGSKPEIEIEGHKWQWKALLMIFVHYRQRRAEARMECWRMLALELAGTYNRTYDANQRQELGFQLERIVDGEDAQ